MGELGLQRVDRVVLVSGLIGFEVLVARGRRAIRDGVSCLAPLARNLDASWPALAVPFRGERGEFGTGARGANPVGNCKVGMLASVLTAEQGLVKKKLRQASP